MLKKMIVQGLVAAGICAGGASLYSAHAQSTAGQSGSGQTTTAQPARPADTGYLTPGQGAAPTDSVRGKRHHDDDDDDDRGKHSERSRHEGREGGR